MKQGSPSGEPHYWKIHLCGGYDDDGHDDIGDYLGVVDEEDSDDDGDVEDNDDDM